MYRTVLVFSVSQKNIEMMKASYMLKQTFFSCLAQKSFYIEVFKLAIISIQIILLSNRAIFVL